MVKEGFAKVSFYIVAHADDWQLFMQPNVYNDLINPGCKVVFIITTAGDAGTGPSFSNAREEGMKSSIRMCLAPLGPMSEVNDNKIFNEHTITCSLINNSASYFLRLPDGNIDGRGFEMNSFQSLSKFKNGEINNIKAVDASASYEDWKDLGETIEKLIDEEVDSASNVCINYINPNQDDNPNDHADHIATSKVIAEIKSLKKFQHILSVGYSVASKNLALSGSDLFWKISMFSAYEKALFDASGYSTLKESVKTYREWCMSGPQFITIEADLNS